jgi:predicted Rossmann fold flavoprotein
MTMETKVCVIGAGPAGLMAAIFSAKAGAGTIVIEANKSPGQKLLLTGGGRCNLTHQASPKELVRAFGDKGNPSSVILRRVKFLSFSLHRFSSQYIQDFFIQLGLRLRLEKDGCVFPVTNRASDARDALLTEAKRLGVRFIFSRKAASINRQEGHFNILIGDKVIRTEKAIIATGGLSYPATGSTGDGYRFARHFGHTIIEPRASLVPLVTLEKWPSELAGTSLDNVKIIASFGKKKIVTTGALLFTHDGIGGPAVLDMSQLITDFLPNEKNPIKISIDLVSNIDETAIEKVILKQIGEHPKKTVANILVEIVPRHIAQILCWLLDLPENLSTNQLNKDMRK